MTDVDPPELFPVRQHFPARGLPDVAGACAERLDRLAERVRPGMRVALAVGSRGITDLVPVVHTAVDWLRERGAEPVIVPAMGSHGGGTAAGQAAVLAGYGVTEEAIGAPVRSSLAVVELPPGGCPVPVYMDAVAHGCDGVLLINRVKPHTDFHDRYESGLVKMAVIGLGKRAQATAIHTHGITGLTRILPMAAEAVLTSGKVIGGIAIVEDAYDATMRVACPPAEAIMDEEPELLALAAENLPRLPVDEIHVLVVDRLGKDVSGVGMDPNVVGRTYIRGVPEPASPRIACILVRGLTPDSHGNALGVGLADVCTRSLYEAIDFEAMYANVLTSSFLERAKLPVVGADDADAWRYAARSCGPVPAEALRVVRIRDTLHPDRCLVSRIVRDELADRDDVSADGAALGCFADWD